MPVMFRNFACPAGITEDYFLLRAFFLKRGDVDFPFGRWDWMITHGWLNHEAVHKIGIWEEAGEIVAIATFDTQPRLMPLWNLWRQIPPIGKWALARPPCWKASAAVPCAVRNVLGLVLVNNFTTVSASGPATLIPGGQNRIKYRSTTA